MTDIPRLEVFRHLEPHDFPKDTPDTWLSGRAHGILHAIEAQAFAGQEPRGTDPGTELGRLSDKLDKRNGTYGYSWLTGELTGRWQVRRTVPIDADESTASLRFNVTVEADAIPKVRTSRHGEGPRARDLSRAHDLIMHADNAAAKNNPPPSRLMRQPRLLGVAGVRHTPRWTPWRMRYEYSGGDTAREVKAALGRLLLATRPLDVRVTADLDLYPENPKDLAAKNILSLDTGERAQARRKGFIVPGSDVMRRLQVVNTLLGMPIRK